MTPEIITPHEQLIAQVHDVISDWLSRNWSEIQDGVIPEMPELTAALQSTFLGEDNN